MTLGEVQLRILRILATEGNPDGMSLKALATALGRKPPPVLMQLKEMAREGLVERFEPVATRGPAYKARRVLRITFVDPAQNKMAVWHSNEPVSWRFPLISRVPDPASQAVLRSFLPNFEARHWNLLEASGAKRFPTFMDSKAEDSVTILVYGSCARGEARPSSDLDLLLIQPTGIDLLPAAKALAAEANLWSPRKIDLRAVRRPSFRKLPKDLQESIRREGITVYSTFLGGPLDDATLAG